MRPVLLVTLCAACSPEPPIPFERFEGIAVSPDVTTDRLCEETSSFTDPDAEKADITCAFEGGQFADTSEPKDALVVMTWNVERNYRLDEQIALLTDPPDGVPLPDVLLGSEFDRGCERSGEVNGAFELAQAAGYDYVFGVEFVEGVRPLSAAHEQLTHPCEHGQAILSRYPIGNVTLFRHPYSGNDVWDSPTEPRIGTRADLEADILVGDRVVHVVSVHYDDQPFGAEAAARLEQAIGTADNGLEPEIPTVVGGDMNTAFYFTDLSPEASSAPAAKAFWDRGWVDTHDGQPDRITVPFRLSEGSDPIPAVVDLLWVREDESAASTDPSWCPLKVCGSLSDHLPVWITYDLASSR